MKYLLLLLTFNWLNIKVGYAQQEDTYQSPELIKTNKVKSVTLSYQWNGYDMVMITDYNRNGEIIQQMDYDSGGRKRIEGYVNVYDSMHQLYSTYHLDYTFYDNQLDRLKLVDQPDTLWTIHHFDTGKQTGIEQFQSKNGQIAVKDKYYSGGHHTIHEIFSRDGKKIVSEKWYEAENITQKEIVTIFYPKDEKRVNKCYFKNVFDAHHRILHRSIQVKSIDAIPELFGYFSDVDFSYWPNGLISNKTYTNHSDLSDQRLVIDFKYTFWDEPAAAP